LSGHKNGPFLGRGLPSIFVGHKKARISGLHSGIFLDGQKYACFPGQFALVIPDVWSASNAAGKYAGQPLNANCVNHAEGLALPALCP